MRHISGIAGLAEKVIGAGKRNEAFGMLCRRKNVIGVINIHGIVGWGVENEKRLVQAFEVTFQILFVDIFEKCVANPEVPAGECHFNLIFIANFRDLFSEQTNNMCRIEWRPDRHNSSCFRDAMRGGEHSGAAETVTDQERGRREPLPQMIGRCDQIFDVRGKRCVGELAFTGTKTGEIEAEHADAAKLQSFRDVPRRPVAHSAGEAMREQSHRANWAVRPVE